MSISLLLQLWQTKLSITPGQRLVLHCLAYYVNDAKDGLCCPSYHTISEITGLSRRGVIKIIDQLCFMGLLVKADPTKPVKKSKLLGNNYRINLRTSELSSPLLVNSVHHASELSSPNIINDLITDLKEIKIKKKRPETSAPQSHLSSVLQSTAKLVIDFLRLKTGRNYQYVDTTLKPILERLKEGVTLEQCKQVIARKHSQWSNNPEMEKYLRPSTLFKKSNFYDKYLPELVTEEDKNKIMKKE